MLGLFPLHNLAALSLSMLTPYLHHFATICNHRSMETRALIASGYPSPDCTECMLSAGCDSALHSTEIPGSKGQKEKHVPASPGWFLMSFSKSKGIPGRKWVTLLASYSSSSVVCRSQVNGKGCFPFLLTSYPPPPSPLSPIQIAITISHLQFHPEFCCQAVAPCRS